MLSKFRKRQITANFMWPPYIFSDWELENSTRMTSCPNKLPGS